MKLMNLVSVDNMMEQNIIDFGSGSQETGKDGVFENAVVRLMTGHLSKTAANPKSASQLDAHGCMVTRAIAETALIIAMRQLVSELTDIMSIEALIEYDRDISALASLMKANQYSGSSIWSTFMNNAGLSYVPSMHAFKVESDAVGSVFWVRTSLDKVKPGPSGTFAVVDSSKACGAFIGGWRPVKSNAYKVRDDALELRIVVMADNGDVIGECVLTAREVVSIVEYLLNVAVFTFAWNGGRAIFYDCAPDHYGPRALHENVLTRNYTAPTFARIPTLRVGPGQWSLPYDLCDYLFMLATTRLSREDLPFAECFDVPLLLVSPDHPSAGYLAGATSHLAALTVPKDSSFCKIPFDLARGLSAVSDGALFSETTGKATVTTGILHAARLGACTGELVLCEYTPEFGSACDIAVCGKLIPFTNVRWQ